MEAVPLEQKRVVVIANPRAGDGHAFEHVKMGRRALWGRGFEAHLPSTPQELAQVCASIDPIRTEAVVVIGGDGTVNLVIQEFIRMGKRIPIYPFAGGTANDLASELETRADWTAVEDSLNQNRYGVIDLISVNGVPFATVAGIGVGARLTHDLNHGRTHSRIVQLGIRSFKKQIYSLLSLKTILLDPSIYQELRIESGSFNQTVRSPAVFICNQNRLSGNIRVANQNANSDGKFSVLVIPEMCRLRLVSALLQLNLGHIPAEFISFSTNRVRMSSRQGKTIQVFGDGDTLVESSLLDFKVMPNALPVVRGTPAPPDVRGHA